MATSDEHIPDVRELQSRHGDDTPPLMNKVPEPPPSHWGKRTGRSRFESEEYLKFFYGRKPKEQKHGSE